MSTDCNLHIIDLECGTVAEFHWLGGKSTRWLCEDAFGEPCIKGDAFKSWGRLSAKAVIEVNNDNEWSGRPDQDELIVWAHKYPPPRYSWCIVIDW